MAMFLLMVVNCQILKVQNFQEALLKFSRKGNFLLGNFSQLSKIKKGSKESEKSPYSPERAENAYNVWEISEINYQKFPHLLKGQKRQRSQENKL